MPTEDYQLAMAEQRKIDLSRIQEDLERRRARQEAREREAKAEREAKELEGCTFAPQLMTKRRRRVPPTPQAQTMKFEVNVDNEPETAGELTEQQRDINKFLED